MLMQLRYILDLGKVISACNSCYGLTLQVCSSTGPLAFSWIVLLLFSFHNVLSLFWFLFLHNSDLFSLGCGLGVAYFHLSEMGG